MNFSHTPEFQRHFLHPRFWPTWLLLLVSALFAWVPVRVRAWLGDLVAYWLVRVDSKRRRLALRNLSLCYPQLSEQQRLALLRQHSRVVAHAFLGFGQLLLRSASHLQRQFDIEGLDIVERQVAAGKGIILLTPHSLALEYAGQCLSIDRRMVTIVRVHHKNDVLDWVVTAFRHRYSYGGVYDNSTSMRTLVREVRSGKWLYYLPDDDRAMDNNVFAPFYGIDKASVPTLGRLARACNAAVIPMMTAWSPDRLRFLIRFHAPLETLTGNDEVYDATQVNRAIERILDEDPAQYMWSAKIFRVRPEGEPDLYRDI
jgi:lauroyl-KDO2-lipid IV(A) myristoyltransferase